MLVARDRAGDPALPEQEGGGDVGLSLPALRRDEHGAGLIKLGLKVARIELQQHLPAPDRLVVGDEQARGRGQSFTGWNAAVRKGGAALGVVDGGSTMAGGGIHEGS